MKLRIFFAVLLVAGAWIAGRSLTNRGGGGESFARGAAAEIKAGERVTNESYKLAPGARVEVTGIHGPVEVATIEGDTAEVRVVTTATDARDLEANKITVEAAADRIVVRGAQNNHGGFWRWMSGRSGSVSHRVELRVPRRVELRASGIHGDLKVGALEGSLNVTGVHGDVEVARAVGRAELTGVHGNVSVGLASLSADGVRVTGVHGQVDLRFAPDANADVSVNGLHGSVNVDNPRVTVEEDEHRRFEGRVGSGGSPVRVSGVHGDVTLARAD